MTTAIKTVSSSRRVGVSAPLASGSGYGGLWEFSVPADFEVGREIWFRYHALNPPAFGRLLYARASFHLLQDLGALPVGEWRLEHRLGTSDDWIQGPELDFALIFPDGRRRDVSWELDQEWRVLSGYLTWRLVCLGSPSHPYHMAAGASAYLWQEPIAEALPPPL